MFLSSWYFSSSVPLKVRCPVSSACCVLSFLVVLVFYIIGPIETCAVEGTAPLKCVVFLSLITDHSDVLITDHSDVCLHMVLDDVSRKQIEDEQAGNHRDRESRYSARTLQHHFARVPVGRIPCMHGGVALFSTRNRDGGGHAS